MSNPVRGEFSIRIQEKDYRFKVGTSALCAAQEQLGKELKGSIPTLQALIQGVMGLRLLFVRVFIWAALQKYHPDVALDQIDDLIDAVDEAEVPTLLGKLLGTTVPDQRDKKALEGDGKPSARPPEAQAASRKGRLSGRAGSTPAPDASV